MNIPEELKYTEEHEWVRIEDNIAVVGITDFAQGELGDIVYLEIDTLDSQIDSNEVFGTVEAVKTVSDLFMPIAGKVVEVNPSLEDKPELVNDDPYGEGWILKLIFRSNHKLTVYLVQVTTKILSIVKKI